MNDVDHEAALFQTTLDKCRDFLFILDNKFSFKLVSVSLVFQDDENPGRFMKILSSKMASDQESFTASAERRNSCHIYNVAVNGVKYYVGTVEV